MNFIKTPKFFVLWLVVLFLLYFFADQPCAWFAYAWQFPWFIILVNKITQLGISTSYIAVSFALFTLGLVLKKQRLWQISIFVLLCVVISGIICDVFKIIFGRARPYQLTLHHIYGFKYFQFSHDFWSFPSGHATTMAAVAVSLSYLFPRYWFWLFLLVLAVMLSRIFLLMHYPSDVWTGFYLGALTSIFVHQSLVRILPEIDTSRPK